MTRPLLLRGALVLDGDPARGFAPADVLIQGERIAAVGRNLAAPDGAEVRDLAGGLLIPGLVNAHTHSPYQANVGLAGEEPLELWSLANAPGRMASPDELGLCARLAAAEMLLGGVTGVVDMVRLESGPVDAGLDAIAGAYVEAGMRAAVAPVVADLPLAATVPLVNGTATPTRGDGQPGGQLDPVERFHERWQGWDGRIEVQVGPSGPQCCSDALYAASVTLARRLGARVHTHALETALQREQAILRWGQPMLEHLADAGLLGPETTLAHLAWPTMREIELVAETGAVVVHNPASNCVLGSGRMPLPELLRAGAVVALGTDAASCNDGLSMFEAMKWAAILHRPFTPDWRDWPRPAAMLGLATWGGAAALGRPDDLGRIAPGYLADLVALDLGDLAYAGAHDLARQTVMRGHPGLVRDVLVNGRTVVRDRRLLTLDVSELLDAARALADRPRTSNRGGHVSGPPNGPDSTLRPALTDMLVRLRGCRPQQALPARDRA